MARDMAVLGLDMAVLAKFMVVLLGDGSSNPSSTESALNEDAQYVGVFLVALKPGVFPFMLDPKEGKSLSEG